MGAAIGQVLPTAVGVALSPLPIVAVVLMLVSARGRANGPAFVVGWLVGLAIVGAIVLSIASAVGATDHSKPAAWVSALKLALGVLLLLLGLRQWRGRPQDGEEVPAPKWMGALETFTPVKAFGAGGLLSGVNPKNLLAAFDLHRFDLLVALHLPLPFNRATESLTNGDLSDFLRRGQAWEPYDEPDFHYQHPKDLRPPNPTQDSKT